MNPKNEFATDPLLTDMYQITMAYAYWKSGRHEDQAVFDLFFRKCPFGGEFTIFAGLSQAIELVKNFRFNPAQIGYLRQLLPQADPEFFNWLSQVDCSKIKIYALREGSLAFPRVPLLRVEGPLAIAQLLETGLLNLVNFATLMTTNAARFRLAAGPDKSLLEFGLRRAQGPDGAMSASRYSYLGGFDATSNVLAGQVFGIPMKGTHAHAFVQSFTGFDDIKNPMLKTADGECSKNFVDWVKKAQKVVMEKLELSSTNVGELAAFTAYAMAFPNGFLALVDTYDTLQSGVPNFLAVALALKHLGYDPVGIRLDSGDLAYLSKEARKMFASFADFLEKKMIICASNDIDEQTLWSLRQQGHEIDVFGVGTHLVTCKAQPALGGVYKLVEVNGRPRIKLSQDAVKTTLPGRKDAYRLYGEDDSPILDLLVLAGEDAPQAGQPVLCLDPFDGHKRVRVTPKTLEKLHQCFWDVSETFENVGEPLQSLFEQRNHAKQSLEQLREDHKRPLNPTPYKVSVSQKLYDYLQELWSAEAPIPELK